MLNCKLDHNLKMITTIQEPLGKHCCKIITSEKLLVHASLVERHSPDFYSLEVQNTPTSARAYEQISVSPSVAIQFGVDLITP